MIKEPFWDALLDKSHRATVLEAISQRWWRGETAADASAIRQIDATAIHSLCKFLAGKAFVFEPWQVAAYVTALRTKGFVILAGISGTGKSKLPALVAQGTGGQAKLLPVRPDWTDSSEVLGYVDIEGRFRPGTLLEFVREAADAPSKHFVCIVDEMNLARVEHYFAEVLSRIEDRRPADGGGFKSSSLIAQRLHEKDQEWANQALPANIAIVGTVNMDESAHGFSRKVLDRAFTIELSDVSLESWKVTSPSAIAAAEWAVSAWYPRAIQLGSLGPLGPAELQRVESAVETLADVNRFLITAQLQVGYRTRDEVALFVLHASAMLDAFVTKSGEPVDPLDLALQMKVLPRLAGGSNAVRRTVLQLLGWSISGQPFEEEDEAQSVLEQWDVAGRSGSYDKASFPRTAARLCLMWERLRDEGFTSFWA